jgi:hypothetical protein
MLDGDPIGELTLHAARFSGPAEITIASRLLPGRHRVKFTLAKPTREHPDAGTFLFDDLRSNEEGEGDSNPHPVWFQAQDVGGGDAYLRRVVNFVPGGAAVLFIAANGPYTLYANGRQVGAETVPFSPAMYDLAPHLLGGLNVLVIRIKAAEPARAILAGYVKGGSSLEKLSSHTWRGGTNFVPASHRPEYSDVGLRPLVESREALPSPFSADEAEQILAAERSPPTVWCDIRLPQPSVIVEGDAKTKPLLRARNLVSARRVRLSYQLSEESGEVLLASETMQTLKMGDEWRLPLTLPKAWQSGVFRMQLHAENPATGEMLGSATAQLVVLPRIKAPDTRVGIDVTPQDALYLGLLKKIGVGTVRIRTKWVPGAKGLSVVEKELLAACKREKLRVILALAFGDAALDRAPGSFPPVISDTKQFVDFCLQVVKETAPAVDAYEILPEPLRSEQDFGPDAASATRELLRIVASKALKSSPKARFAAGTVFLSGDSAVEQAQKLFALGLGSKSYPACGICVSTAGTPDDVGPAVSSCRAKTGKSVWTTLWVEPSYLAAALRDSFSSGASRVFLPAIRDRCSKHYPPRLGLLDSWGKPKESLLSLVREIRKLSSAH